MLKMIQPSSKKGKRDAIYLVKDAHGIIGIITWCLIGRPAHPYLGYHKKTKKQKAFYTLNEAKNFILKEHKR